MTAASRSLATALWRARFASGLLRPTYTTKWDTTSILLPLTPPTTPIGVGLTHSTPSENGRCLREEDGGSRRKPAVADRGLGRPNWADSRL